MQGMNKKTGKALPDMMASIRQSITEILTTPVGSRVMRRDFGSNLFDLIDEAMTPQGRLKLIAATADAIHHWEPRILLERVESHISPEGYTEITLSGRTREGLHLSIPIAVGPMAISGISK